MKPSRAPRPAILLAACSLLAASGCQGGPLAWTLDLGQVAGAGPSLGTPRTPGSNVSLVTPVSASRAPTTPAPTQRTSEAPASAAPSVAPSAAPSVPAAAEPSYAPPEPGAELPPAFTYSDVEPAEQAAVEQAIATDPDLSAYLPADLIHDGGVVLFRLLQAPLPAPKPPANVGGPIAPNTTLGPPPPWTRTITAKSGTQLILRKGCLDGVDCAVGMRPVRATVQVLQRGELRVNDQSKPYGELVRRQIVLRPRDGTLVLAEVSPLTVETQGGRSGLDLKQVTVFEAGGGRVFGLTDFMKPTRIEEEPRLAAGQRLRVEVEVETRRPGTTFVFASRAGNPADRVLLRDDGKGADKLAGDFRFSGEFFAASTAGLQHLAIEVIDPVSYLDRKAYRAFSVAIAYRVP